MAAGDTRRLVSRRVPVSPSGRTVSVTNETAACINITAGRLWVRSCTQTKRTRNGGSQVNSRVSNMAKGSAAEKLSRSQNSGKCHAPHSTPMMSPVVKTP